MKPLLAVSFLVVVSVFLLAQSNKKLELKGKKTTQTATYALFPYSATYVGFHDLGGKESGCYCGPNKIIFSPPAVPNAKVGQPVTVQYDASQICHGQTIQDLNGNVHPPVDQIGNLTLGSVEWEPGVFADLPLEWGVITYSGYAQSGPATITINIKLQCVDIPNNKRDGKFVCGDTGKHTCPETGTIPVTVQ